jgi:hypothetical protein
MSVSQIQKLFSGYSRGEQRPLPAYAGLIGAFNALFAVFLLIVKRSRRRIPERLDSTDIVLLGLATHKLSRLLTRDSVTSALRAPFTRFKGVAWASEVEEEVRGTGLRHALGELLTCPYCAGQWIAALFTYGLVLAPRVTRLVAGVFAIVTLSDFLHAAYEAAMKRVEQGQARGQ